MNILKVIGLLILWTSIGVSQDNWEQFANDKRGYYFSLENSGIENFSCLLSSSEYIRFVHEQVDSAYYYPLKIIWTKSGKIYYIMQPFPPDISDAARSQLVSRIEELKKMFQGILSDWQQFSLLSPFADIPHDASVRFGSDTVALRFQIGEDNQIFVTKKLFSRGGQLAKVEWHGEGLKIATYPYYKEVENKWLCGGWQSQFYRGGEIISGMAVILDLKRGQNIWLPTRFDIIAQTRDNPNQRSVMQLFVRNYILNEDIEILSQPTETPSLNPGNGAQ